MRGWLLGLILALSCPAFAANHFVLASATGTASGADWTNAFTALPASLTCGDLYYVGTGSYGKHTFNDGCSVVTEIRAATVADHGTPTGWSNAFQGTATFSSADAGTAQLCVWEFTSSHYLINGNGVRNTNWQGGYLIKISDSNTNAHECTVTMGASAGGTVGAGTWVQDITFDYVEMEGVHQTTDTAPITCCSNVFETHCGSVGRIAHSLLHDGGNVLFFAKGKHESLAAAGSSLCNASSTGAQFTFEYNYLFRNYSSTNQHGEMSECDEGQYCVWRYSRFRDGTGTAMIATPSGCGRTTCNIDNQWDIYGNWFESKNTFQNNGANCGLGGAIQVFDSKFSGDINVLNNTFVNMNSSICSNNAGGGNLVFPGAEADLQNVTIKNNYWHNCDNFSATTSCPAPNTCAGAWTWTFSVYGGGQSGGGDSSAQTVAGSLFVSVSSDDFHLASDTNAWTSLSSPFNTDPDGTTRTSSRGAFQFVQSGTTALPAPAPLLLNRIWDPIDFGGAVTSGSATVR